MQHKEMIDHFNKYEKMWTEKKEFNLIANKKRAIANTECFVQYMPTEEMPISQVEKCAMSNTLLS